MTANGGRDAPERSTFDAGAYWDHRLRNQFDLRGVGYLRYGRRYNEYLYRLKERRVARAIAAHGIPLEGASVLDLGCGTGFWLRWYHARGASKVAGLDISPAAVARLSETAPWATVRRADLAAAWPLKGPFDLVSAFDVFYHVIEEGAFERALASAVGALVPGGWLLLTDRLRVSAGERESAQHVRFRDVDRYAEVLDREGAQIRAIYPLFRLLNGGLADAARLRGHPRLRWLAIRAENVLAPLLYRLDEGLRDSQTANLRLLVASRVGGGAGPSPTQGV